MSADNQPRKRKDKKKNKDEETTEQPKGKVGTGSTKNHSKASDGDGGGGGGSGVVAKAIFLLLLVALSMVVALILVELRGKQKAALEESASQAPETKEDLPPSEPPTASHRIDEGLLPPEVPAPVLQEAEEEPEPIEATPPLEEYVKVVEEVVVEAPPSSPPTETQQQEEEPGAAAEPEVPVKVAEVPAAAPESSEAQEKEEVPVRVEEVITPVEVQPEEEVITKVQEIIEVVEVVTPVEVVQVVEEVVPVERVVPVEQVVEVVEEVLPPPQPSEGGPQEQIVKVAQVEETDAPAEVVVVEEVTLPAEEAIEEPTLAKTVLPSEAPRSAQEEKPAAPAEKAEPVKEEPKVTDKGGDEEEEVEAEVEATGTKLAQDADKDDVDWSQFGKEGGTAALTDAYLQVESLAEDILALDPNNAMVGQLAPHLSGVLRAMEEGQTEGLLDTLKHIQVILEDVKTRLEDNEESSKSQKVVTEDKQPEVEEKAAVNSAIDNKMQKELDAADDLLPENPRKALHTFGSLLHHNPKSARATYGRARSLDLLAETEKSNSKLEQAILTYRAVLDLADEEPSLVPLPLLRAAAERCIDRMKFRGFFGKALRVQQRLLQRFPEDVTLRNNMGVTYLLMNQGSAAKEVFEAVLQQWPEDGFAQVHYGFVLKTTYNNVTGGAYYMQKGIESGADGTQDERFFFHLGDALQRQGKVQEAYKLYDEAVEKGMFLSRYQRSLYNVDRLTSRPFWEPEQTTYQVFFRKLEENWEVIRDEGVALLGAPPQDGFRPEAENLRDTGDWKQFELFTKGRKITANCVKAPQTCKLIEAFPAAASCKRGQVKFSVMQPQTHVHAHTGPTNCRLRAHLGLVVPEGLRMRVAQETTTWEEGKLFIFDDSWEHEVWHEGDSLRLVLIVDVWHPELSEQERNTLTPI